VVIREDRKQQYCFKGELGGLGQLDQLFKTSFSSPSYDMAKVPSVRTITITGNRSRRSRYAPGLSCPTPHANTRASCRVLCFRATVRESSVLQLTPTLGDQTHPAHQGFPGPSLWLQQVADSAGVNPACQICQLLTLKTWSLSETFLATSSIISHPARSFCSIERRMTTNVSNALVFRGS
jgi:hypothetical protein